MSRHSESLWRLERWRPKRETPVVEAGTEDINDYVSENGLEFWSYPMVDPRLGAVVRSISR
jgi:hypothetical protein